MMKKIQLLNTNYWCNKFEYSPVRTAQKILLKQHIPHKIGRQNKFFTLQWHLTNYCDQKCKHCYIYNDKNVDFSTFDLKELICILNDFLDSCKRMYKKPNIVITGGDPILHPNFFDFINILKAKNISFSILGNPFHLNATICKFLKEAGCNNYQMSIDGIKDTHDYLRKPGSFECTIDKIELLKANKIPVSIMTTVSKINFKQLPDIIKLAVKLQVDNFAFARYCPTSNDIENMVSPQEYHDLLDICWSLFTQYIHSGTTFSLKDHLWVLYLYEKKLFPLFQSNTIMDGCHCGISHMTILPNGTVYACRRFNSPIGKVPEESLFNIYFSNKLDKYRNFSNFKKCASCKLLNFCRGCPATSYGAYQDFFENDPQCWADF